MKKNENLTIPSTINSTYTPSSTARYSFFNEKREIREAETPNEYLCPITLQVMQDPVMAADGQTYERYAIEEWFAGDKITSPMTGKVLPHLTLTPNYSLRSLISSYKEQLPPVEQEQIKKVSNNLSKQEDQDRWAAIVLQQEDLLNKKLPTKNNNNWDKPVSFSLKESYQHTALFSPLSSHSNTLSSPLNKLRLPFVIVQLKKKGLLLTYQSEGKFISKIAFEAEGKDTFNDLVRHLDKAEYGSLALHSSVSTQGEKLFLNIETKFSSDAEDLNEFLEEFINKLNKSSSLHGSLVAEQKHKILSIEYKKNSDLITEDEYKEKAKAAYGEIQKLLETTDKSDLIITSSLQKDSLFLQTRWTDDAEDLKDILEEEGIAVDNSEIISLGHPHVIC